MKRIFDAVASRLSLFSSTISDVVIHWLLYPFLLAVTAGTGVWTMTHPALLRLLVTNRVPKDDRIFSLVYVGGALLLVGLFIGLFAFWHKRRNHRWPAHDEVAPVYRLLSVLFVLPILAVLDIRWIQLTDPIFVVGLISLAAVAMFRSFSEAVRIIGVVTEKYRLFEEDGPLRSGTAGKILKYAPVAVVVLLCVAYCVHFSLIAVNGLQAFKTRSSDMAIYTNIMYHSSHGDPLGCSLVRTGNHASAHFDPILVLFSPLYLLFPRPEMLVVLQAVWLGLGVFPAFWLGRRVLKNAWAGVAVAVIYAALPSLHLVNLFEFHSLSLLASPVLLALFFIEARYYKPLFALLPFILFIREDAALLMCFVGLSAILTNRREAWVGATVIFVSLVYFVIAKWFFMTSPNLFMTGKGVYNYTHYFDYMIPHRGGMGDLVLTLINNPVYSLRQAISLEKFEFIVKLLGPLLFIPLLAKRRRVMLLYGVVFLLLASNRAVFNDRFHYQVVAIPILIGLLPYGINQILSGSWFALSRGRLLATLLLTLISTGVMSGVMFGGLDKEKMRRIHVYEMTWKEERRFDRVMALLDKIEPDASVQSNDTLAPYVANRMYVYTHKHVQPKSPADYLVYDRKRTPKEPLKRFDKMVAEGIYKEIGRYGTVVLYKRVPEWEKKPAAKNSKTTTAPYRKPKAVRPPAHKGVDATNLKATGTKSSKSSKRLSKKSGDAQPQ